MLHKIKAVFRNPYFFSITSKVFGVLIGFIFTIFQARYLGAEIKGQVTTVNSIVGISAIISGLGIYHAYPYFKRNTEKDVMPVFIKIALLLLSIYTLFSVSAIFFLKPSPQYIAVLILNPLIAYDNIISYITLVEVPNKRNATDMLVMLVELVALSLMWIFARPSFVIGVFVITIKDVLKALLFTIWWKKKILVSCDPLIPWIKKIVKFGFFPMLALLMNTLNYRVDVLMLNGKVSDAAIGVYSIGVMLAERVWLATDAMKGVMVSKITKGKSADETAYVIRICNSLCVILMLGIVIFGNPFLHYVFGKEFSGSYQITLIILLGVFPMNYYKMIDAYNVAIGKQTASFIMLSIGVVCNILANLILIPSFGIYGAGIASVISYSLCSSIFVIYFCKLTNIPLKNMIIIGKGDIKKIKKWIRKSNG